jgi:hypothetical protein
LAVTFVIYNTTGWQRLYQLSWQERKLRNIAS